jgi:hypothetical protein
MKRKAFKFPPSFTRCQTCSHTITPTWEVNLYWDRRLYGAHEECWVCYQMRAKNRERDMRRNAMKRMAKADSMWDHR